MSSNPEPPTPGDRKPDRPDHLAEALVEFEVLQGPPQAPTRTEEALLEFEQVAGPGHSHDGDQCEYCGEDLADLGLSFHEHVEANDICRFQWDSQQPYIREDAGSD